MKVHVLQHVPFEGLGSIEPWLERNKARIGYTRFFETPGLPAVDAVDMIVVLGGPMSANDEDRLPWLVQEKQFIHTAVVAGIPILGICLGAQLIASAVGARVYRNAVKEIGWYPVRAVSTSRENIGLPETCSAFHWHGETFDLPEGASLLASSDACKHQAFQLNRNVLGLQFHLETTPESAAALLDNCKDELVSGPYIQPESQLRAIPISRYREINAVMDDVLSSLTAL